MVKLIVRLEEHKHCGGCGDPDCWADEKTELCLYCLALKLKVESRKAKLISTMSCRFAYLSKRVRAKLEELRKRCK